MYDNHTYISTHPYKHTYAQSIHMNTFKRLNRLDLEIPEIGHQERLTVNKDIVSH
jgi:hypothetical protein